MKRIVVGVVVLAVAAACTRIIQKPPGGSGGGNGGTGGSPPPPPPPPPNDLHVQILWSFNLPRSAVNLAPSYTEIHDGLVAALNAFHVIVDQEGVAPQYSSWPGLVWGQSDRVSPTVDLMTTLRTAADSGRYEPPTPGTAPEQGVLASLGQQFGTLTVPPELVGGDSIPVFGAPRDGLVIVVVHSTRRLCGDAEPSCALHGQAPGDYLTSQNPDGTLTWIAPPGGSTGFPASKVAFIHVVTSEGESPDAFRTRCAAVAGFPRTLLDVLEPSPSIYYNDTTPQIGSRGPLASEVDLCNALGEGGPAIAASTASAIAQKLGSP